MKRTPAMRQALALLLFATLSTAIVFAQPPNQSQQKHPWSDASMSPDERADLVLKELTLQEKLDFIHGQGMPGWGPQLPNYYLGNGGAGFVLGVPRLEIPFIQMS